MRVEGEDTDILELQDIVRKQQYGTLAESDLISFYVKYLCLKCIHAYFKVCFNIFLKCFSSTKASSQDRPLAVTC